MSAVEPRILPGASESQGRLGAAAREVAAGATVGCIILPFCVTAGVLAYEPLGPAYVGAGAAAGILCAVAGGAVGAIARSSSFIPNMPSVAMALIQASFVASLLAATGGNVAVTLALMPASILLAGLWQIGIAASGLARAVKFTPYPVLAGFVTGLAVLTFLQQAPRLLDANSFGALARSLGGGEWPSPATPAFGLAIILSIRAFERWAPRWPATLASLVLGTALFHLAASLAPGLPLGGTVGAVSLGQASFGLHLDPAALGEALGNREVLGAILLTSLTIGILGTLDYTFAFRSAQNMADLQAAPRRDLAGQGLSNLAAALAGGLAVTSSLAFATTNHESGGRTRLSTLAVAAVLLAAALAAPGLIGAMPIVVLAAILVSISLKMWDRWCLTLLRDVVRAHDLATRTRARRDAAVVATVAAATVLGQPVVGALVGVALACLIFIVEMSRPVIRMRLDGSRLRSKRIRSQGDGAVLARHGARTIVLDLQGVLFFGNADDLASAIKALERDADILILDLHRVSDLDTSGASVLQLIARRCRERGILLMIAAAGPSFRAVLDSALAAEPHATFHPDLDEALEEAEDLLLARHAPVREDCAPLRLHETDLGAGLSEAELAALSTRLSACRYRAGEALCRAGEPADRLWLLTRGSVSVRIAGAHGARRIAGLGPGTAVGEMGLLDRRPRSADVVADEEVEALVLSDAHFDALLRDEPHLGQSLLATIARLTAQRLRATSDELRLAEI